MNEILKVNGLSKSYARDVIQNSGALALEETYVLKDLNLSIPKGKISCLVGGNGAGKTTLFNIISGYTAATAGSIYFNNKNILSLKPESRMGLKIGRLFQEKLIFKSMTVMENMLAGVTEGKNDTLTSALFKRRQISTSDRAAKEKALHIFKELLQENDFLSPKIDALAGTLSYGQQRILAVCRLLMSEYDIILMDEPTAGVNELVIKQLIHLVSKLKEKRITLFIIEHNAEFVKQIADYVYWLENGSIKCALPCDTIFEDENFKREFVYAS